MNKFTPIIIMSTFLLASTGIFWYAKQQSAANTPADANILIVGTNAEYPPFSFMEKDTIVGFDIDLINEIAAHLNKTVQLIDMPFDALLPKIQLGDIQVIAAGMTATAERAHKVLFTKPYITGDPLLMIVLSTAEIPRSVEDLKGKDVVVNEGYTADLYLSSIDGITLKRLATPAEGFMALTSGRAYAFVAAQSSVAPFLAQESAHKFHAMPIADTTDSYSLAISKQYPELLTEIQHILDRLEKDGTLTALKAKWDLP